jgi:O-antigen/teichoic acid export membrane protein
MFARLRNILKNENNSILIKNVVGAFGIRGLGVLLSFASMPLYIRFFNDNIVLGLWFTLLSVLSWIMNFDMGIGNGLRNHLTKALFQKKYDEAKLYLSSAYISIFVLCVIFGILFVFCFNHVEWRSIFNLNEGVLSDAAFYLSIKIVFFGILIQFFLKLINSVLYAIQKSALNNLLTLITNALMVVCVLVIPSSTNDDNVIKMAVLHVLAVAVPLVTISFYLFLFTPLRNAFPSIKCFSLKHAKDVLSLGGVFFYVQILYMVIMCTNEYLITYLSDSKYVVEYRVYHSIYGFGGTLFALVTAPVWSLVTKALAEKNYAWVEKLYGKLIKFSLLASAIIFLIVPFTQILVNIWLQSKAIETNVFFALIFACMGSLMIFNSVSASIANGMGRLGPQAICFSLGVIAKFVIAFLLVKQIGWIGVVVSNVAAIFLYSVVQPLYLKRQFYLTRSQQCDSKL